MRIFEQRRSKSGKGGNSDDIIALGSLYEQEMRIVAVLWNLIVVLALTCTSLVQRVNYRAIISSELPTFTDFDCSIKNTFVTQISP